MNIKVLLSALADLDGDTVLLRKVMGVCDYSLDCLFFDIDLLALGAGVRMKVLVFHRQLTRTISPVLPPTRPVT